MDWLSGLSSLAENPWIYLPLLFVYAVLAAVLLPIPVEFGLLDPFVSPVLLVLTVAAGKALGGALVFRMGTRMGESIERYLVRFPRLIGPYRWIETTIGRHGYWALFAFLSIPFMTDSAPVYLFSVLNPRVPPVVTPALLGRRTGHGLRRALRLGPFVGVNFAAAVVRSTVFLALPLSLGWK